MFRPAVEAHRALHARERVTDNASAATPIYVIIQFAGEIETTALLVTRFSARGNVRARIVRIVRAM